MFSTLFLSYLVKIIKLLFLTFGRAMHSAATVCNENASLQMRDATGTTNQDEIQNNS